MRLTENARASVTASGKPCVAKENEVLSVEVAREKVNPRHDHSNLRGKSADRVVSSINSENFTQSSQNTAGARARKKEKRFPTHLGHRYDDDGDGDDDDVQEIQTERLDGRTSPLNCVKYERKG